MAESATGSFLYPPERFDSTEQYLDFFTNEPISDQVLSNATHAYDVWRKAQILEHVTQANARLEMYPTREELKRIDAGGTRELQQMKAETTAKARAEADALFPMRMLPRSGTRSILRAYQIAMQRGLLPGEYKDSVLAFELPVKDEILTVEAIWDRYRLGEWAGNALTENDYAQTEATSRVAILLARQSGDDKYEEYY